MEVSATECGKRVSYYQQMAPADIKKTIGQKSVQSLARVLQKSGETDEKNQELTSISIEN